MLIQINDGINSLAEYTNERFTSINIIANDGRTLYQLHVNEDGELQVRGVDFTKHNGILRSNSLVVRPNVSNQVTIWTEEYK